MKLEEAAKKLLKQNIGLKKNEKICIVTDRKNCPIFNSICDVANLITKNLTKIHITKKRENSSPLPKLKKKFIESDVIIGITDKSISHCPETRLARKKHGARVISLVEVDKSLFLKAMRANQKKIKDFGKKLYKKLIKCKKVKILTPSGTDIEVNNIKNAISIDDGDSTKEGTLNNIPYGEVCEAPINIANGRLVVDFSRINIKPRDKATVFLRKGKIVRWNKKAEHFVKYLKKIDGEKALKVVELAFGINPEHKKLIGIIIHDEKIFGSVHIAFGGFGDKRKCKIHEDVILLRPTVFFDNKLVIKGGKFL